MDLTTTERLVRLEEFRSRTEARLRGHDTELEQLGKFEAEMKGARRVYMLMWSVLCTAVVLDLTAQAFVYKQQTKNAEDIRGIQESQQLILGILKGDYVAKQNLPDRSSR